MGNFLSKIEPTYDIVVKTGDVKGAGTDSNVYIRLFDEDGKQSKEILLDVRWRDDFERDSTDVFRCRDIPLLGKLIKVEIRRDTFGLKDDWFLEWIKVRPCKALNENKETSKTPNNKSTVTENGGNGSLQKYTVFPCNRWIKADRVYSLVEYDSLLPQLDERQAQRVTELAEKKKQYVFEENTSGLPRQVKSFPAEQSFSNDYKWDLLKRKVGLLAKGQITKFVTNEWEKLEDIKSVYKGPFKIPLGYNRWRSDAHFGRQRLQGCNAGIIKRCDEIPSNLGVWEVMINPFLEGNTLEETIAKKRLYIIDLKDLEGVKSKAGSTLCAPIALFYVRNNGDLMPLSIQLFQEVGENNPTHNVNRLAEQKPLRRYNKKGSMIFLPTDSEYTWLLAKMYFNNADAALHQSCSHLGFTHLICESIAVATHRELSPSHPIFRLLMPHFLYLFAINKLALQKLVCPNGWIDNTMTMGREGMFQILKNKFTSWRFGVEGWLPANLAERGVDDVEALPNYPYRDDALLLHNAIHTYVSTIVNLVYDNPDKLVNDNEMQAWSQCLHNSKEGCGFTSIPGGGSFNVNEEVTQTITTIIFLSSVAHAAANFCQYDDYAFPPNYPAILKGEPPRNKDALTEQDIIKRLPTKDTTVDILVVTKLLSERGTRGLGDFEIQYMFEPKAVAAVRRFRKELEQISVTIQERNKTRNSPYPYLNPAEVPNAISI